MSVHFLIADRDPLFREECRHYLVARGHSAEVASNDLQCIEQIEQKQPSVLVLDANLLWNGGERVMEWLKSRSSPEQTIVLLTDNHATRPLPPHLRSLVAGRLERPQNLQEMEHFVDQLYAMIDVYYVCGVTFDPLAVARVYQ